MSLILPSYQSGFAPRDYEPAYPSLWQGCVAAYAPLLGPTGLVLRDSVGKNDGVLTNGPTWDISGGRYALGFDGSNDYVACSRGFAITSTILSVSSWIRVPDVTASSSYPRLIDLSDGTNSAQVVLDLGSGGVDQVVTKHSQYQSGTIATQWGYLPAVNVWEHIAVIFNSSSSVTSLYRNGILQTGASNNNVGAVSAANQLFIGARRDLGAVANTFWQGQLDDIRIYNRPLSDSEIKLLSTRRGIAYEPKRTRKWYFRGFSPKKKLTEAKITSTIPGSYQTGYAPRDGEPVYPELWKNCVGAWSAGLGPSNILRDNSPAKNHGSLVNGPTYQVSGGQYALGFDGTDDRVNVSTSTTYDISSIKTISAWINGSSFDGAFSATDIIAKDTIATRDWAFMAYDTNANANNATISFSAYGTGGGYLWRRTSSEVLAVGGWNHVAFTYDGALNTNEMRLYLNGVEQASSDFSSGTYGSHKSTSNALLIGLRGGIDSHWNGALDDIRIYNRILSASEIRLLATRRNIAYEYKRPRTLFRAYDPIKQVGVGKITSIIPGGYHTGVGGVNNEPAYPELTKGLVGGWCPSLGVTGGILRDNSGQGNHGVLLDGTTWQIGSGKYALDFDGSNDAVEITLNQLSTVFNSNLFSFCIWAYVRNFANFPVLATSQNQTNVDDFLIETNNTGSQLYVKTADQQSGLGGARTYTLSTALSTNQWFHVGFIRTGLGDNGLLYVNGKLETSYSGTLGNSVTDASQPLKLGRYATAAAVLNGQLDDIRLYNRVLSPNEIRLLASRRGIGYDYKTHRSYSKTQSSGLRKKILTGLP